MRALLLTLILTSPAAALTLEQQNVYTLNRPASLEFDPNFCGLWIANESGYVVLSTLAGETLRRFRSDLSRVQALALQGNDLLLADGMGSFQWVTRSGDALGPPFRHENGWADTEGLAFALDGTIISVEDDPERLSWLTPEAKVIREVNTMTFDPPLIEAQGIAMDPRTGYLLIVDDQEGTNSLYEMDPEGRLIASVSLRDYGLDPEGIAIRPGSGEVFIAFDSGRRIVSFSYTPTLRDGQVLDPAPPECIIS